MYIGILENDDDMLGTLVCVALDIVGYGSLFKTFWNRRTFLSCVAVFPIETGSL